VVQACHALSIDEDRHAFQPLVWDEAAHDGRIEQVWFAGVHSNVGGGYPKQGMSLVALDWMMARAEAAGLRFNCSDRDAYREHASADDKLYNPRAGLGTFYRWKPRDIEAICAASHMPVRLHISAIERIAHGSDDYAPENLPPHATVVTTPAEIHQDPTLIRQRAANVEAVYNAAVGDRSLLSGLGRAVFVGRLSYYLFLAACLTTLVGVVIIKADGLTAAHLARAAGSLIAGIVSAPWTTAAEVLRLLWRAPALLLGILVAFLASSIMARSTDAHIGNVASAFWHRYQPKLRDALKEARTQVPAAPSASLAQPAREPLCWRSAMSWHAAPPATRIR
jgi:hypothetical protein